MINNIDKKILDFKTELINTDPEEVVEKYLIFGNPYVFEEDITKYFKIKTEISKKFNVDRIHVFVVGSAKLGFSIAPDKRWKKFNEESDIDMVLISDELFEENWKKYYKYNIDLEDRNEEDDKKFKAFRNYLFKGWVRPDLLPQKFIEDYGWYDFFNNLSSGKYGINKINGAIFKDLFFFKNYHINNLKLLKVEIK